jgi:hypothetical protein
MMSLKNLLMNGIKQITVRIVIVFAVYERRFFFISQILKEEYI